MSMLQNKLQKEVFISLVSLKKLMKEKKPQSLDKSKIKCTHTQSQTYKKVNSSLVNTSADTKYTLSSLFQVFFILQRCCFVAAALQVLAGGAFFSVNSAASEESVAHQ